MGGEDETIGVLCQHDHILNVSRKCFWNVIGAVVDGGNFQGREIYG
jgi:hypothetical protein